MEREVVARLLVPALAFAALVFAAFTAGHAILYKRDTRAVIGWVGFIVLLRPAGAILYWMLAVNRVRRRAIVLRPQPEPPGRAAAAPPGRVPPALRPLACLGDRVGPFPLCAGNRIVPLENGDEAFPPMLAAIDGAQRSIALSSYTVLNLRNHRKSLIVDGCEAFTGPAVPGARPGRHPAHGRLRQRLGVHDRRDARRRRLAPSPAGGRRGDGQSRSRRTRRALRGVEDGAVGGTVQAAGWPRRSGDSGRRSGRRERGRDRAHTAPERPFALASTA